MRVLLIEDKARIVVLLRSALERAGFVLDAFGLPARNYRCHVRL